MSKYLLKTYSKGLWFLHLLCDCGKSVGVAGYGFDEESMNAAVEYLESKGNKIQLETEDEA